MGLSPISSKCEICVCAALHQFINLISIDNPGPTTLQTKFYIKFLQTTCAMMNGGNQANNLTMFYGTVDLRTLSQQQVQLAIFDFTLQVAQSNSSHPALASRVPARTLLLFAPIWRVRSCAWHTRPSATLSFSSFALATATSRMWTWTIFARCTLIATAILLSAQSRLYQQLMSASQPSSSQCDYPVNVCAHFQDGLDPRLIPGVCCLFLQHIDVQFSMPLIRGRHPRAC